MAYVRSTAAQRKAAARQTQKFVHISKTFTHQGTKVVFSAGATFRRRTS